MHTDASRDSKHITWGRGARSLSILEPCLSSVLSSLSAVAEDRQRAVCQQHLCRAVCPIKASCKVSVLFDGCQCTPRLRKGLRSSHLGASGSMGARGFLGALANIKGLVLLVHILEAESIHVQLLLPHLRPRRTSGGVPQHAFLRVSEGRGRSREPDLAAIDG